MDAHSSAHSTRAQTDAERPRCAQHTHAGVMQVDFKPDKPGTDAYLGVVARIGWAAAVCGASSLAEQCTRRAASSQVRVHLGFLPRGPSRHKLQCWRPPALSAQSLWFEDSW